MCFIITTNHFTLAGWIHDSMWKDSLHVCMCLELLHFSIMLALLSITHTLSGVHAQLYWLDRYIRCCACSLFINCIMQNVNGIQYVNLYALTRREPSISWQLEVWWYHGHACHKKESIGPKIKSRSWSSIELEVVWRKRWRRQTLILAAGVS